MSPSARNQPMITRPFRGQRLDRKLFHRPRHRRAAPPPQEIRFCGHCWAVPRDRSRGRHVPVRGSGGGRQGDRLRLPSPCQSAPMSALRTSPT